MGNPAVAASSDKWYESRFASALLGVVALVALVVFLTLIFRQNPAALVKVLGGVATLAAALAGLIWGIRRGRQEVGNKLLPVLQQVQSVLARGGAVAESAPKPAQVPGGVPPEQPKVDVVTGGPGHGLHVAGAAAVGVQVAAGKQLTAQVDDALAYLRQVTK